MTTLEQIKQDLAQLNGQQLQQVAVFIASVKRSTLSLAGRKDILKFLEAARSRHSPRTTEDIDRSIQTQRDAWDGFVA